MRRQHLVAFCLLAFEPALWALLFPSASNMNLVSSVSVPVVEYFPERVILIDWCFTMAYDLPDKLSAFYNIPIWPGIQNPKAKRAAIEEVNEVSEIASLYKKYDRKADENRHASDFSAGELYQSIEDFLVSYGFDETCLLRAVCDLSRHPFDEAHQSILTDVLTFLLTPSQHRGFDSTEHMYRETYEHAELQGFLGHEDCALLYPKCQKDFLGLVTNVLQ